MKGLRKFIRRILLFINILLLLIFIFTCYAVPGLSPGDHWPLGLLGLVFPFILFFVVVFIFFWLIFHYQYAFFGIVAIAICWNFFSVFFAFNLLGGGSDDPSQDDITVMSYNVRYFKNFDSTREANGRLRDKIIDLIAEQKPDILCLQEFYTSENPNDFNNKSYLSKKLKLPYRYFSSDHNYKNNHSGVIVFSKYPVVNAGKIDLMKNNDREVAVFADIKKEKDTFRIFTTHLQSIYLSHEDLQNIEKIKQQQDSNFVASKKIAHKLQKAFTKRGEQAEMLRKAIENSPYPVLVCGDFNDPPNSYTYFKVRGNLKDAFLEKGFGIGRTYSKISPTLRIDYIFTSRSFKVRNFYVVHKPYSDHFPIVARVKFVNGNK